MNTEATTDVKSSGTGDILFECPKCGKSLEIDARGAGYIIVCPDCQSEIQVPAWNSSNDDDTVDASEEERQRIEIEEALAQLQARIVRLEKQQQLDNQCFKRIGDEIVLIQAALDRITEIVESRNTTT